MATLTVVVGLAGSGKSHLTRRIAEEHSAPAFHDFLSRHLIPEIEKSEGFCSLLIALQSGKDCVANEVSLVHEDKWRAFTKLMHVLFEDTVVIQPIFFENDPEQCILNVKADVEKGDSQGRLDGIAHYTKGYWIPPEAQRVQVYRP